MALKSKKRSGKSSSSKKKSSKKKGLKRYIGSVWLNDGRHGEFRSISIDNLDTDDEYYRGKLIWFDAETDKYYFVKSLNLTDNVPESAPENLEEKLVIDLENEHHVEEADL